jgi:hypothetical protein
MANEIWHSSDETKTLYGLIWRKTDDKVWNDTDSQFDTYTDADILKYDIPLTNHVDSDYHTADFPSAISAGVYRVQVMEQVGGAIDADADIAIAQGEIYWDGTAEIDIFTLDTTINDDVIGADGDTLEILSDELDGLTGSVFKRTNVYAPGE